MEDQAAWWAQLHDERAASAPKQEVKSSAHPSTTLTMTAVWDEGLKKTARSSTSAQLKPYPQSFFLFFFLLLAFIVLNICVPYCLWCLFIVHVLDKNRDHA